MGTPKSHQSQALDAMQRNKRMARTLGCLVASMTLGAALLDWVQPKRLPAATARTELMSIVRQGTAPGAWRSIHLDSQPPNRSSGYSHFVIRADGQAFPTDLWQNRQAIGDTGVVRIALESSDNSNQVTREQIYRADELVQLLQKECSIPTEQVHLDNLAVPTIPAPAPSRHAPGAPKTSRHK
jgi:hypothetical protein